MHFLFNFFAALFTHRIELRQPRVGDKVVCVQSGRRNAYDGYDGYVEHTWNDSGFVINGGGSILVCALRYGRSVYRMKGSNQLYTW